MRDILQKWRTQGLELWNNMSPPFRGASIALLFIFFVALGLFVSRFTSDGQYEVLFSRLNPTDAAEVAATLREQGVPYKLGESGADIWVPKDDAPQVRLDLAAEGIPRGGVVGFEAFDTTRLGMTDFERQVQYQRALQGELTRTIRAFDQVADAHVHLVMPERSLFIEQQRDASASVVLQLRPGTSLSRSQVQSIVHLLSHSVEGLDPEFITVADTHGNVLTDVLRDEYNVHGSDAVSQQLEVQQNFENRLAHNVQSVLEQVYGPGNVVARVHVDLDFDQLEELHEIFSSPIDGKTGIPRSRQIVEERYTDATMGAVGGVPGVDSNIPGYVEPDNTETGTYEYFDETINYELNRIVTTRSVAPGSIKRLSVAVIIDNDLDEEQIENIRESVSAVVGVDTNRGDTVSVQSMQFAARPVVADLQPEIVRSPPMLWYILVILLLIGLTTMYIVLRRRERDAQPQVGTVIDEEIDLLAQREQGLQEQDARRRLEKAAKDQPEEVARLIRVWLAEE